MGLIHRLGVHRGLLRSGRAVVLLSTVVVTIIVAAAGFTIWHNRQSAFAERQRSYITAGTIDGIRSLVSVHPLRDYRYWSTPWRTGHFP